MNILDLGRDKAIAFAEKGWINLTHYDVCKALASGKTIEVVAGDFRLSTRHVARIKNKCQDCR